MGFARVAADTLPKRETEITTVLPHEHFSSFLVGRSECTHVGLPNARLLVQRRKLWQQEHQAFAWVLQSHWNMASNTGAQNLQSHLDRFIPIDQAPLTRVLQTRNGKWNLY